MSDWKSVYAGSWAASSARELRISADIARALGVELVPQGTGAGSAEYVRGSTAPPATSDYRTVCGRVHVEITGPLHEGVSSLASLWIRPDKMAAAERVLQGGSVVVVVHNLPITSGSERTRCVVLDVHTLARWRAGEFLTTTQTPRGVAERYVEIPARDVAVVSWGQGLARMRRILGLPEVAGNEYQPRYVRPLPPRPAQPVPAYTRRLAIPGGAAHTAWARIAKARAAAAAVGAGQAAQPEDRMN